MARIYFHCSNSEQVLLNYSDAEFTDLTTARQQAETIVRSMTAVDGSENWRDWMVHASDDLGESVLALPFSSILGSVH